MPPVSLDALLQTARQAQVSAAHTERQVDELERWARRDLARTRPWWRAGAVAAAAALVAAAVLLFWWRRAPQAPVVPVGDRVALVAEPGTQFRVLGVDAEHTEILVEQGTVTARLWKGARAHSLALRGGGVVATATGTIYSLTVSRGEPSVRVHEGSVQVSSAPRAVAAAPPLGLAEPTQVAEGQSWPAAEPAHGMGSARRLRAWSMPTTELASAAGGAPSVAAARGAPPPDAPPAAAGPDAGLEAVDAVAASVARAHVPPDARDVPAARDAPDTRDARDAGPPEVPMTAAERWRLARLRRAQGQFREALRQCVQIADSNDATWAPIALAEAMRITLGPLADPQQTLLLARRMRSAWPRHTLMIEVRAIECRALGQLGRGAECAVLQRNAAP